VEGLVGTADSGEATAELGCCAQTSLKIKSSGAEVLWPVGRNEKRDDLPKGQAWHWVREHLEVHTILLPETNKFKMQGVGWPKRRCHRSTVAKMQGDQKAWGTDVAEDSERT
jgi:hypothetical protein